MSRVYEECSLNIYDWSADGNHLEVFIEGEGSIKYSLNEVESTEFRSSHHYDRELSSIRMTDGNQYNMANDFVTILKGDIKREFERLSLN